ncbi:MAG TPA: class I SAM-dependent methyltransferase [Ktedonobacterales bacterium]|jgi:SAM-dependent methyltransferase|nr:class I SAM-dependent methyltransferase [Ktedonobacterales bacterium]
MGTTFDPITYKNTTRDQWQTAAEAWNRWEPVIDQWLGDTTEAMLEMVGVHAGSRVLDVAAGAGGQTLAAARRVGPSGYVLATDISSNILDFAASNARAAGLTNVETRVLDGETLDVEPEAFDAVISRVGLIYFPDQQKALDGMRRALKPGGRVAAIVYTTAEQNAFFSLPISIIRRRAQLPPPLPGQPGPFSLGAPGALEEAYRQAGFRDIATRVVAAPLHMSSVEECVRFERESFGALHQMLAGVDEAERASVWEEIATALRQFETADGFVGPCQMLVAVGTK